MRFAILTTNHGKHSDEKLGFAVADDIVDVAAAANEADSMEARKLANEIGEIAKRFMRAVADREHAGIEEKGHEHLFQPLDAHPETVEALEAEILDAMKASPVAKSWVDETGLEPGSPQADNVRRARKNVRDTIEKWVRTSQHMHRDYFARWGQVGHHTALSKIGGHDPDHEHVRRWKDFHDAPTPEAHRKAMHELLTGERIDAIREKLASI